MEGTVKAVAVGGPARVLQGSHTPSLEGGGGVGGGRANRAGPISGGLVCGGGGEPP